MVIKLVICHLTALETAGPPKGAPPPPLWKCRPFSPCQLIQSRNRTTPPPPSSFGNKDLFACQPRRSTVLHMKVGTFFFGGGGAFAPPFYNASYGSELSSYLFESNHTHKPAQGGDVGVVQTEQGEQWVHLRGKNHSNMRHRTVFDSSQNFERRELCGVVVRALDL